MPDNPESPRKIQISLRTFLVAVLAAGMTLGILGQLFRSHLQVFLFTLFLISTIAPYVLAIVTILWIGIRRTPVWSLPVCAKCQYDLRHFDFSSHDTCPRCGANLTSAKALAFVRKRYRSRRLVGWSLILTLMPMLGLLSVAFISSKAGPGPGGLGLQSNQELIQKSLPPQVDQPWVWQELERRLAIRKLSQQEVDDAVKILIGHMKTTQPNGWNQPLSWQDSFLRGAASAGLISEPVLLDLCDAYYGTKARILPLPRIRENSNDLHIEVEYGSSWGNVSNGLGVGVQLLWDVTAVRLDGEKLDMRRTNKTSGCWSGYRQEPLPVGDHVLEIKIECAYIDETALLGLNTNELPASSWPEARKRWTQTVSTKCIVHTKDEPLLAFVTDAARSPQRTGGIQINHLVVQPDRDGKKRIGLGLDFNDRLEVPIGFDLALKLGDETIPIGHVHAFRGPGRSITGGHQLQKRLPSVDPSIRKADIIFTPSPKQIERYREVEKIWGETIVIPDVPIDRFDLEQGEDSAGHQSPSGTSGRSAIAERDLNRIRA